MLVMDNVKTAARIMAFMGLGHAVQGSVLMGLVNMDAVGDRRLVRRSQERPLRRSFLHRMPWLSRLTRGIRLEIEIE
jgi:hypothetical protein